MCSSMEISPRISRLSKIKNNQCNLQIHNASDESSFLVSEARRRWKKIKTYFLSDDTKPLRAILYEDLPAKPLIGLQLHDQLKLPLSFEIQQVLFAKLSQGDRILCLDEENVHFLNALTCIVEKRLKLPHVPISSSGFSSGNFLNDPNISTKGSQSFKLNQETATHTTIARITYLERWSLCVGWRPGANFIVPICPESFEVNGDAIHLDGILLNLLPDAINNGFLSIECSGSLKQPASVNESRSIFTRFWRLLPHVKSLVPCQPIRIFTARSFRSEKGTREDCHEDQLPIDCSDLHQLVGEPFPTQLLSLATIATTSTPGKGSNLLVGWKFYAWLKWIPVTGEDTHRETDLVGDSSPKKPKVSIKINTRIHEFKLTAVLQHSQLRLLVTGDCSGCLKVWSTEFDQLYILGNHCSAIRYLGLHPLGEVESCPPSSFNGFLSIDTNCVMKSWQHIQWKQLKSSEGSEGFPPRKYKDLAYEFREVDSVVVLARRKPLITTADYRRIEVSYATRQMEEVEFVCRQPCTNRIIILGKRRNTKGGHSNYRAEYWTAVQTVEKMRLVNPSPRSDATIAVVICTSGPPNSVHLMQLPRGTVLTTALCDEEILDAVWHWQSDRLFVLLSNHRLAVFNTLIRPCQLLGYCKPPCGMRIFSGPLCLFPIEVDEQLDKTCARQTTCLLLPIVGLSDGCLAILCPNNFVVLSEKPAHCLLLNEPSKPETVNERLPIVDITTDESCRRLITTGVDGKLHIWRASKPPPISILRGLSTKCRVSVIFKRFPLELEDETNLFVLYSGLHCHRNGVAHRKAMFVSNNTMDTKLSDANITCNLGESTVTKEAVIDEQQSNSLQVILAHKFNLSSDFHCLQCPKRPLPVAHSLYSTIVSKSDKSLSLDVWHASSCVKPASLDKRQSPNLMTRQPVNLSLGTHMVNSYKLPYSSTSECLHPLRVAGVSLSEGEFVIAYDRYLWLIRACDLLPQAMKFQLRLARLSSEPGGQQATLALEPSPWDNEALKMMKFERLKLVCGFDHIHRTPYEENRLTDQRSDYVRRRYHAVKLQAREADLKKLTDINILVKRKTIQNTDDDSRTECKTKAFKAYFDQILVKKGYCPRILNSTSVEAADIEGNSPVADALLAIAEAEKVKTEEEEKVSRRTNSLSSRAHKRKGRRKAVTGKELVMLPKQPERQVIRRQENELLESEKIEAYDNFDMRTIPLNRTRGFFPRKVLQCSRRLHFGWSPNSSLLSRWCADVCNTGVMTPCDEDSRWYLKNMSAEDDFEDSVWYIDSPVEEKKVRLRTIEKALPLLPVDTIAVAETPAENTLERVEFIPEMDGLVTGAQELDAQDGRTDDTLGPVNDAPNIFMTELAKPYAKFIPEYIKPYERSRWLSSTGLLSTDEEFCLDPSDFIVWLIRLGYVAAILQQASPPCPPDEDAERCQTFLDFSQALIEIHVRFTLKRACISAIESEIYRVVCKSDGADGTVGKPNQFPSFRLIWACIIVTIELGGDHWLPVVLLMSLFYLTSMQTDLSPKQCENQKNMILGMLDRLGRRDPNKHFEYEMIRLHHRTGVTEQAVQTGNFKHCVRSWLELIKGVEKWLTYWLDIALGKIPKPNKQADPAEWLETLSPSEADDLQFSEASTTNAQREESQSITDGINAINTFCQWYHVQYHESAVTPKPYSTTCHEIAKVKDQPRLVQGSSDPTKTYQKLTRTPGVRLQSLPTNLVGLRDPARLSCDQPWRAYRTSLLQRFPPLILFQLSKCSPNLYTTTTTTTSGEQEKRRERLERLIKRLGQWKQRLLKSRAFGNAAPDCDTGFEQLGKVEDVTVYEIMLHHLLDEQQKEAKRQGIRPFPLVKWFVPRLSGVLPTVHTWKLPALAQNDSMLTPCSPSEQSAVNSVDASFVISVDLHRIVEKSDT